MTKTNLLLDFINIERGKYESQGDNLFAFSLGQASRYFDFVSIIFERYKDKSKLAALTFSKLQKSLLVQSNGTLSVEQINLHVQLGQVTPLVQLEIESFYIFGKIFLDKIAFFLRDYFGEAKGIKLISHHEMQKNHERFRLAKGLIYPDGFSESINFLQKYLIDFRDDEIVHKPNPRNIKGITFYTSGDIGILKTQLYPNEHEFGNHLEMSPSLSDLMLALEKYVEQVIIVIETNRHKSRFNLRK